MDEFKARYRGVDVLLLDDVQFLEGEGAAARGVLPHLQRPPRPRQAAGVQLRPAAAQPGDPGGPAAQPLRLGPDHRHPAARRRDPARHPAPNAAFAPAAVPGDVLQFIAERVVDNIRELEGALTRVTAYAALTHQRIDLEMAADVLQDLLPPARQASDHPRADPGAPPPAPSTSPSPSWRARAAASPWRGPARSPCTCAGSSPTSRCRASAALFGGRDHTTVLHGMNTVHRLIQTDKAPLRFCHSPVAESEGNMTSSSPASPAPPALSDKPPSRPHGIPRPSRPPARGNAVLSPIPSYFCYHYGYQRTEAQQKDPAVRIRAERDDLVDVLSRAARAVSARSPLPILQGLLITVAGRTHAGHRHRPRCHRAHAARSRGARGGAHGGAGAADHRGRAQAARRRGGPAGQRGRGRAHRGRAHGSASARWPPTTSPRSPRPTSRAASRSTARTSSGR